MAAALASRFAASTRMSAYYSARIASSTPIASHRPTASPTMSHFLLSLMVILPARQLGQHHHLAVEPYWDAERVLGGGPRSTIEAYHRADFPVQPARRLPVFRPEPTGVFVPRIPFHARIKALDVNSTYSRDWSRVGTKAIVLSAIRDSGRLVPSRARPFAFSYAQSATPGARLAARRGAPAAKGVAEHYCGREDRTLACGRPRDD